MSTGLSRIGDEKFYTKPDIAKFCFTCLLDNINISDKIIEPSAGNGVFLDLFSGFNYLAYDILPEDPRIIKQDFLELDINSLKNSIVIGNPPFGRNSCLAKKFIKKCCDFASVIAFILPKSFKKPSMNKVFDINFHMIFSIDIPKNSFVINNKNYDVPCVFQIWKKLEYSRDPIIKMTENNNYSFVEKETADIAFRRVGSKAGNFIKENIKELSLQSHYFIKFRCDFSIDSLNKISFDTDNTTGPKSVSKQELIKALNKVTK